MKTITVHSRRLGVVRQRLFDVARLAGMIGLLLASTRAESKENVDFARDVYATLERSCFECHGPRRQEGGLRLDRADLAVKGGDGGPVLVAGKPAESELLRRISLPRGDGEIMPARGDPLPRRQVEALRAWIAAGARWPDDFQPPRHWAYVAPLRPAPPEAAGSPWPRNPIDAFILARLQKERLSPSPEAEPAVLARRLWLDLVGLPPSPAEVDAFVADSSEQAYQALVERLLASPQFGQRWARPWLDLARYADSHGFQRDDLREVWPYRDWVIAALNHDMPFDQFTIEQIAGDLLPEATESQRVATGFHRSTTINVEAGSDPEETRINQVIDRLNTTAAIWLGTTLQCAQCHDHKYDPFTQRDYYGLLAFLNSTEREADRKDPKTPGSIRFLGPSMTLSDPPVEARERQLAAELDEVKDAIGRRRRELDADLAAWEASLPAELLEASTPPAPEAACPLSSEAAEQSLPDNVVAVLKTDAATRTAEQRKLLLDFRLERDESSRPARERRKTLEASLKALPKSKTLVMRELPQARPTSVFIRGDFRNPGEAAPAAAPGALHPLPEGPPNRLTLARWLVDRSNPLAARVAVNRCWAELFGHGIVTTLEDFGTKGELPTHPELLDWLAVDFMENGWSLKRLLRTIVTSATYRQSSNASRELLARDDRNLLYARGPRFRLDAEAIRDNALAAAGLLCLQAGGPPIRPFQPDGLWKKVGGQPLEYVVSPAPDRYRRGVYVVCKRASPYPSFANFDATARLTCTVKRSRSNTPLQALTLLNDPVYVEAAFALAVRAPRERPGAPLDDQLRHAFRLCLARQPRDDELAVLRSLFADQWAAALANSGAATELLKEREIEAAGLSAEALAAWYAVASALLNLDEMVTKN